MIRSSIFLLSFIFLTSVAKGQNFRKHCPDARKITPCTCHKSSLDHQPVITCSNLTTDDYVKKVFQISEGIPFYSVVFSNISAQNLPGSSVESKRYVRLAIVDSSLTSVFDEFPSEVNLLQDFSLHNVTLLQGMQWELLSPLHSLEIIAITNTQVSPLDKSFGSVMPKRLKYVFFSNTNTAQIGSHAFSPLKNLEFLAIRSNLIEIIDRSMFPKPFRGSSLDFSDNKIQNLPDDFFTDMPNLRGVQLNQNNITTLKETVFGNLPASLQYISLRDNPIKCDCSIKWITDHPRMPFIDGICSKPAGMARKKISELKKSDFVSC